MSKKGYVCIIAILVCLLLITGTYTVIHYCFNYSTDEWFRESIEDADYVIVGEEMGNTVFGGDTKVALYFFNHVNEIHTTFETRMDNNGEKLTSENYRIEYSENYIKIVLIDSNKQTRAYTFFFEDFK